jgi:undecaprenyl diphosphate synthase
MHYPRHVAMIPDGNRTRAKENWLEEIQGHLTGIDRSMDLIQYIFTKTPIEVMTGRWLSTENVSGRDPEYVRTLCNFFKLKGDLLNDFLKEHRINFRRIGSPDGLPEDFVEYMRDKSASFKFVDSSKTVVFAINYGWRDEIMRGIKALIANASDLWNFQKNLTESSLAAAMDLGDLPPVDLVIRTKGDKAHRTSWFMSRWIWYAELYFTAIKYPDFSVTEFDKALARFDEIAAFRNFGK